MHMSPVHSSTSLGFMDKSQLVSLVFFPWAFKQITSLLLLPIPHSLEHYTNVKAVYSYIFSYCIPHCISLHTSGCNRSGYYRFLCFAVFLQNTLPDSHAHHSWSLVHMQQILSLFHLHNFQNTLSNHRFSIYK